MKKSLLTAFVCLSVTGAFASPLSPQEALLRSNGYGALLPVKMSPTELSLTVRDRNNEAAVYVFSRGENDGYLVLSADDMAAPVLGYADSGNFDPNNIPPALNYWLDTYAQQISYARENGASMYLTTPYSADYTPISPLLSTAWDQGSPYNNDCILHTTDIGDLQCVTGCVATAMAQLMNYHQYPERGQGSISYLPYSNVLELQMDFSAQAFEWDNMLDSYSIAYTEQEAAAVAYLMKACGYSVQMKYSPNESGANSYYIMNALAQYFKYSGELAQRDCYADTDWEALIYNHLSKVGPVVYSGSGLSGGHCFVCDGYSGEGYYHFNWGWSGLADGYYLLNALNPTELGIGAGYGEYNQDQSIVLAYPSANSDLPVQVTQYGTLSATLSGSTLNCSLTGDKKGWFYVGGSSNVFNFGLMIEDTSIDSAPQYINTNRNEYKIPLSSIVSTFPISADLSEADLTIGHNYKVTMVTSLTESVTPDWQPTLPFLGNFNYFYLTKTEDGYEITEEEVKGLVLEDFEVEGYISINRPVSFNVTMSNPSVFDLSKNISICLVDAEGVSAYSLNTVIMKVPAGETATESFSATEWYTINSYPIITEAAEFKVVLCDMDNNGQAMDFDFPTMMVYPRGEGPVQPEELIFTDTIVMPEASLENGVYVSGIENIPVNVNINVESGKFDSLITVTIIKPNENGEYNNDIIISTTTEEAVVVEKGESKTVEFTLDFPDADPSLIYRLTANYNGEPLTSTLMVKFEEEITTEPEIEVTSIAITPNGSVEMDEGEILLFTATVLPEDATNSIVTWSITDTTVASIVESELDNTVRIKALAAGETTLVATASDNSGVNASVTIIVNEPAPAEIPATKVEISGYDSDILFIGETITLSATVYPADTTYPEVIWTSSDSSIASIDLDGTVSANNVGTATIKVYVEATPEVSATWEVTVIEDSESGIKGLNADENGYYHVYLLNGQKIISTNDVKELISLTKGIYIINGKKVAVK